MICPPGVPGRCRRWRLRSLHRLRLGTPVRVPRTVLCGKTHHRERPDGPDRPARPGTFDASRETRGTSPGPRLTRGVRMGREPIPLFGFRPFPTPDAGECLLCRHVNGTITARNRPRKCRQTMPFEPNYRITPRTATHLMRIEAARQAVEDLPITSSVLAGLRETARLFSTHYSTMIEGNRLTQEQVSSVIGRHRHFPGRERDEAEVLGYYAAIERLERFAAEGGDDDGPPGPDPSRPGDGRRQGSEEAHPVPGRAERDPRRRQPPDRLHAPGGSPMSPGSWRSSSTGSGAASARASRARSAPGSRTTSSPRSTPTTTATAARRGS